MKFLAAAAVSGITVLSVAHAAPVLDRRQLLGGLLGGGGAGGLGGLLGGGGGAGGLGGLLGGGGGGGGLGGLLGSGNLGLNLARLQTVNGVKSALEASNDVLANAGGNEALASEAQTAVAGLETAQGGIDNIAQDLFSGNEPKTEDRDVTEAGIRQAAAAIENFPAAAGPNPNKPLREAMEEADEEINKAIEGGKKVLELSANQAA